AGPGERARAEAGGGGAARLARAGAGAAADGLPAPRAARPRGRGARPPYAGVGRPREPLRPGLRHARHPRRPLDGARVGRCVAHRAPARRSALGPAAPRGGERAAGARGSELTVRSRAIVAALCACLAVAGARRADAQPRETSKPYVVEYYYKAKWGSFDEFF